MKNFKYWPQFNPRSLNYPEIPVNQFLRSSAAKWPFRIAMIFDAMEITYSELLALSERFAAALEGLGVQKGDRVAIHLPNSPQFAVAYYATMMRMAISISSTGRRTCSSTRDTMFTRGTWKRSWPSIPRSSNAPWWAERT